ncbi:MAG: hypothetical protein KA267_00555 [Gemmatimonadales bacterium]|nr:hypothetical protein [Gemmatimonadales bacterium]MBP6569773.1 hypothetical protein [Gemmatimonadales bacterium]MBP7619837.1 hypothetical protein [Gemmatimonadales bacterium]
MKDLRSWTRIFLTLALATAPVASLAAQGGGGGGGRGMGGGGGGGGTGMVDMTGMGGGGGGNQAPRPLHYDLDGPFSFDSFTVLLTLDSTTHSKLEQLRAAHLATTAVLRDSVKKAATELNLTTPAGFSFTAMSKPELSKAYDKQLKAVRKLDVAFFEKQVKPELNKEQYEAMKKWYGEQRPIGQAARGAGGAGRGQPGQAGQGRGGRGGGE